MKEKEEEEEEGGKEEEEEDDRIDWEYLSSKTEGCQARDLAKLVKRWAGGVGWVDGREGVGCA